MSGIQTAAALMRPPAKRWLSESRRSSPRSRISSSLCGKETTRPATAWSCAHLVSTGNPKEGLQLSCRRVLTHLYEREQL